MFQIINLKRISIWTDSHALDKLTPISIHNIIFIFIAFKRIYHVYGLTIFLSTSQKSDSIQAQTTIFDTCSFHFTSSPDFSRSRFWLFQRRKEMLFFGNKGIELWYDFSSFLPFFDIYGIFLIFNLDFYFTFLMTLWLLFSILSYNHCGYNLVDAGTRPLNDIYNELCHQNRINTNCCCHHNHQKEITQWFHLDLDLRLRCIVMIWV